MRTGELLALTWDDYDSESFKVNKARVRSQITTTKTEETRRVLMPAWVCSIINTLPSRFRKRDNAALEHGANNRRTVEQRADLRRRVQTLTPREHEVMTLVLDRRANKVIAIDFGLSERTVEIHRAKVMEKMGARSVAHLVKMHLMLEGS